MIQRIQSIFLLLVAISLVLYIILPVWIKVDMETGAFFKVFALYLIQVAEKGAEPTYTWFPYDVSGTLAGIGIILAIIEIFSYKNRLTQIKIGAVNSLVIVTSLGLMVYLTYQDQQQIMPAISGIYQVGLFMPAGALIFNSLANRFIRKDEALVRSVDRIR
jgi:hypothetical protein